MEINNRSKRLYRHAIPTAMLVTGLLGITTYATDHASKLDSDISRGLVSRVIEVHPTNNGLAKITPVDNEGGLLEVQNTGQQAGLQLSLSTNGAAQYLKL